MVLVRGLGVGVSTMNSSDGGMRIFVAWDALAAAPRKTSYSTSAAARACREKLFAGQGVPASL
eukprot:2515362-Pyramimonas_sp.AAC.1